MENYEIANILREIAYFLEMDDVQFKPRAYEKAARSVESSEKKIDTIYKQDGKKGLTRISGIGESIAEKIIELIGTGKCKYHQSLKARFPVDIDSLIKIEGIGPKTIKELYKSLKIKTLEELEIAAKTGKIRKLPNFGVKSEETILKGIEFYKKSKGRFVLGDVLPLIRDIKKRLRSLKEVDRVDIAGSTRRWKETIGDIDFLIISKKPEDVMKYFTSMPEVIHIYGKGSTRSSVKLEIGIDADLRIISIDSLGSALQYFTGNKDHNVMMRKIALEKGWKLNEYGIFKEKEKIAGETEEEVYNKLGLQWIAPELRENKGEIEFAKKNKLPFLIDFNDLKGDLQVHTEWSDGTESIKKMAEAGRAIGLEYLVISDHTKGLAMTGGLNEEMLNKQIKEISSIDSMIGDIKILSGCELNISKDGKIDIKNSILRKLDVVGAGIHSNFKLSKKEQTDRIIKVMENENIDMIVHPTCRLINKREPINLDINKIIDVAKRTNTILEIDSFPDRLDLKDENAKKCVDNDVKLAINSDSHSSLHFNYLKFGIATARRGWVTANDVVNTRSVKELLKCLK